MVKFQKARLGFYLIETTSAPSGSTLAEGDALRVGGDPPMTTDNVIAASKELELLEGGEPLQLQRKLVQRIEEF
jgi:hypothetical protein